MPDNFLWCFVESGYDFLKFGEAVRSRKTKKQLSSFESGFKIGIGKSLEQ